MYRDLVKNLKKNYEIKDKILLKMDNLMDFPPIFCQTAEFLPGGRGTRILVKYSPVEDHVIVDR